MNVQPNYTHLQRSSNRMDANMILYDVTLNGPDSDFQRSDSNGNICTTLAPYINSTFASPYTYYATDVDSFNISTYHPKGLQSYTVNLLHTNNSAFLDSWVTLNFSNHDSEHKILVNLNLVKTGEYYDLDPIPFIVRFKTQMNDGLAYTTEDVTFNIINDPVLLTNISDQTVRIGKLGIAALDTRIHPDKVSSDYQVD